jgi:hypothetical protein
MSATIARTRTSISLFKNAAWNAQQIQGLGAGVQVQILEDKGEWLKVQPLGMAGTIAGYAPRLGIAIYQEDLPPVFPCIEAGAGLPPIPSVPRALKLAEFLDWLASGAAPTWIPAATWNGLEAATQKAIDDGIRSAVQQRQAQWDAWLNEVQANGRRDEASLNEWLAVLQNGADVFSVRAERVFSAPASSGAPLGWINVDDILLWSGHVQRNNADMYKLWYQISIFKLGKVMRGWYRGDLLEEYTFPTALNDPDNPQNAQHIFDMTAPRVRIPADPEIAQTLAGGYNAAQYINIKAVIGKSMRHFNLCGELCCAALVGDNVIPMLQRWLPTYPRAKNILNNNIGTTVIDLNSILKLYGLLGEQYIHSPGVTVISARLIRERLQTGYKAIAGVMITGRGVVDPKGSIAHWVVLEDIQPVGNDGWVRVYNPFMNREEVYPFGLFEDSMTKFPYGLWIKLPAA